MNSAKEYVDTTAELTDQKATDVLGKHVQEALMQYRLGNEPKLTDEAEFIGLHVVATLKGKTNPNVVVTDTQILITFT